MTVNLREILSRSNLYGCLLSFAVAVTALAPDTQAQSSVTTPTNPVFIPVVINEKLTLAPPPFATVTPGPTPGPSLGNNLYAPFVQYDLQDKIPHK